MAQAIHIPIELIPTFLSLAEELNVSRCAKKLGISQPALTRQLKTLEESFGAQLFVRQSRGLALTQTGRQLRKEIVPGFENLRSAIARIQNSKDTLNGPLTFGCFSEIGTHLVAPALFEFVQIHPGVTLDIRYQSELDIIAGVLSGQLHLGLVNNPPHHENLRSYKLLDERIHMVTSNSNPDFEKNPSPRFAGYRAHDRLLFSFLKTHSRSGARAQHTVSCAVNSHQAILTAVTELNLYAVLPHHSIETALKDGKIRLASRKELINRVHLIVPDSDFPERICQEALRFLRQKFKATEREQR